MIPWFEPPVINIFGLELHGFGMLVALEVGLGISEADDLEGMNSGADPEVHEAFSPKTRANSAKSKGGGSANSRKGLGSATGKQVK